MQAPGNTPPTSPAPTSSSSRLERVGVASSGVCMSADGALVGGNITELHAQMLLQV